MIVVALLNISTFGSTLCGRRASEKLGAFAHFPKQSKTQVVQYLATLRLSNECNQTTFGEVAMIAQQMKAVHVKGRGEQKKASRQRRR
jgi:hypothetical protein